MAKRTVFTEQVIEDFFKKLCNEIPDNDIWYGYFYVQERFFKLLNGRIPHVTEREAEFIRGLYEGDFNFRQIQNITGRSLETLHRIIKEDETGK